MERRNGVSSFALFWELSLLDGLVVEGANV